MLSADLSLKRPNRTHQRRSQRIASRVHKRDLRPEDDARRDQSEMGGPGSGGKTGKRGHYRRRAEQKAREKEPTREASAQQLERTTRIVERFKNQGPPQREGATYKQTSLLRFGVAAADQVLNHDAAAAIMGEPRDDEADDGEPAPQPDDEQLVGEGNEDPADSEEGPQPEEPRVVNDTHEDGRSSPLPLAHRGDEEAVDDVPLKVRIHDHTVIRILTMMLRCMYRVMIMRVRGMMAAVNSTRFLRML